MMPVRHVVLALLVAALWGCNFVAIKVGLGSFPPLLFSALRFVLAALPVLFVPRPPVPWQQLVGVGVSIGAVQFACLFTAMQVGMPAGLASLLLQVQAFFTALLASGLRGERLRIWQALGMTVAFGGIALIALRMNVGTTPLGLLLVIIAALGWAIGNLVLKRVHGANMLHFTIWMSLVPPFPLLAASLLLEGVDAPARALAGFTTAGVVALLYIVVASTWIGYGLWGWLMQRHPVTLVAPFSLLVPLAGMASAALLLGERYDAGTLGAAVLVLGGLTLNVWGGRLPGWRRR